LSNFISPKAKQSRFQSSLALSGQELARSKLFCFSLWCCNA